MPSIATHGLEDCLDRIEQLAPFPSAAHRILEVTRTVDASLDELEEAVALDPVLAGRILAVANSPLYGVQAPVSTLRRAILMLGFLGTRNIAVSLAVASVGRERDEWGRASWRHAMATGWACRALASYARGIDSDALFVAGLLHDLGHQLLLLIERQAMEFLHEQFGGKPSFQVRAERAKFGFDHAQLGAACLRRWALPEAAAELVEHHHEAVTPETPRALALLKVADVVAEGLVGGVDHRELVAVAEAHPATERMLLNRGGLEAALEQLVLHRAEILRDRW